MTEVNFEAMREELLDSIKEELSEAVEELDDYDKLELGNKWRSENYGPELMELDDYYFNKELSSLEPYDVARAVTEGNFNLDDYYFTYDGYELSSTDDPFEECSAEDIADMILELNDMNIAYTSGYSDIDTILSKYQAELEKIDKLEEQAKENEYRRLARKKLADFVNCEADWRDLFAVLDLLVNTDGAWAEPSPEESPAKASSV